MKSIRLKAILPALWRRRLKDKPKGEPTDTTNTVEVVDFDTVECSVSLLKEIRATLDCECPTGTGGVRCASYYERTTGKSDPRQRL